MFEPLILPYLVVFSANYVIPFNFDTVHRSFVFAVHYFLFALKSEVTNLFRSHALWFWYVFIEYHRVLVKYYTGFVAVSEHAFLTLVVRDNLAFLNDKSDVVCFWTFEAIDKAVEDGLYVVFYGTEFNYFCGHRFRLLSLSINIIFSWQENSILRNKFYCSFFIAFNWSISCSNYFSQN